jgi:hypothetical protein
MDQHLRRRLENLRLMRVVRRRDEYCVEQLDTETGAIGVTPGPSLETWRDAECYRFAWAGLDVDRDDVGDEA